MDDYPYEYGKVVSRPTAEEGRRSFSLDNESKLVIKKWAIDKVVFENRIEERCDYLVLVERVSSNIYYWIELKGSDVVKACRQILKTVELVTVNENAVQEARIITSKTPVPALRDINYLKLEKQMLKLGGRLKVYTNQGSEKI